MDVPANAEIVIEGYVSTECGGVGWGPGMPAIIVLAADDGQRGEHGDWTALVAAWQAELEKLAAQFAAGHAAVDPKRLPQTCQYCDLGPLCRIRERSGVAITDGEGGA